MHEQSETVRSKRGFRNVYGSQTPLAGKPLPRLYTFERDEYPSIRSAVSAARKRSKLVGRPEAAKKFRIQEP